MIGGLQGENGDLDIKYLKQKNLKMSVVNIGKLQENTAAMRTSGLRNFAAKRTTFRCPRLISQPCEICLQLGVIGLQWL